MTRHSKTTLDYIICHGFNWVSGVESTATGNFDQGILENISAQNPLINIWTHSNPRTSIDNYQATSRTECYGVEVRIAVSTQPG